MISRCTLVGLLAAVMAGPIGGRARADGGFQTLDLKSVVNMGWRDLLRLFAVRLSLLVEFHA